MEQIGQNIAMGAILFVLVSMLLGRIPVLGFFFRLSMRLMLLFSPIGIAAMLAIFVWYHGMDRGVPQSAAEVVADPAAPGFMSPIPPERPR